MPQARSTWNAWTSHSCCARWTRNWQPGARARRVRQGGCSRFGSYTGTGGATTNGTCVTMPGTGTISTDLLSGEIPAQGGMRFAGANHKLDVTNLRLHIGSRTTSADVSVDGGPATNVDFLHYTLDPTKYSVTPTTVSTKPMPLNLTSPGRNAFTTAFAASPVEAGQRLFDFSGEAKFTKPSLPSVS
ncbi:HtaA domain-containing protein [Streptomyces netropsis]|uniref:HtaA domain-containing protein n=1 Tax=Streptomyces netropsis TaxID=55404 RepID=UPI0037918B14